MSKQMVTIKFGENGEAYNVGTITGSGAPASSTVGAVGALYMDETNGAFYKCTAVENGAYTWVPLFSSAARIGEVTLSASKWAGSGNLFSQVVNVEGVTPNSQVDLTPDVQQLAVFYEKDLTFVTENENGVVTVYAIGEKPTNDYTIQVTIKEVSA